MVHQVVINVLSDQSTRTITIEEAAKEAPKEEKKEKKNKKQGNNAEKHKPVNNETLNDQK